MFEPFVRRDAGAGRGGTGLGLAIARAIVVAHGGRIAIEGAPGGGTVVVFRIPVDRTDAPARRRPERDQGPRRRRRAPDPSVAPDDAPANGYEVHEAGTGEEALAAAAARVPDLLVLDLGLPDMDGTEVIRRLRGWSDVPVIVLSVRDRQDDKIAALDAGADDYVTKPFGLGELLARIRAAQRGRTGPRTWRRCWRSAGSPSTSNGDW